MNQTHTEILPQRKRKRKGSHHRHRISTVRGASDVVDVYGAMNIIWNVTWFWLGACVGCVLLAIVKGGKGN